jgi:hypothetical protein
MPVQRAVEPFPTFPAEAAQAMAPAWVMPELPLAGSPRPASTPADATIEALQRSTVPAGGPSVERSFRPLDSTAASAQAALQREPSDSPEAVAQVSTEPPTTTTTTNETDTAKLDLNKLDIDELSERIWSRIRRKLRIERERSRGIV